LKQKISYRKRGSMRVRDMRVTSVYLAPDLKDEVKRRARAQNMSVAAFIESIVAKDLRRMSAPVALQKDAQ